MSPRRYRPRALYLWLALLTCCAVFAATAGARETVVSRTQAVRQTVAAATPPTRTITVSAAWTDVQNVLSYASSSGEPTPLSPATMDAITGRLRADFNQAPVSLTPAGTDWSSLTVPFTAVAGDLPGTGASLVKIEVTERQPFGPRLRLLSGDLPAATPVPSAEGGSGHGAATLQVVMTRQTAATLGLHAGSTFVLPGGEVAGSDVMSQIKVLVTGIVVPVDPASSFWSIDPGVLAAHLQHQGTTGGPYWAGAVLVGPGEANEVQSYFGSSSPRLEWVFPLDLSSVDGQQVQPLSAALDKVSTQVPALSGFYGPVAATLTVSSSMLFALNTFIATAQSVDTLLWLLYLSLTVAGLAVLLLAARMVALRRSGESTVIRARGASLRQIAFGAGREAAILCVPAAVVAAVLAILVVPGAGAGSAGGWWPPVAVLAVAILGPALLAAWQHRLGSGGSGSGRSGSGGSGSGRSGSGRSRAGTRLVIEAALVAASVAGLIAFRDQGAQAGAGVNLYTSSAPVLVAIPAVIVVLRLYPLVLRVLLRAVAGTARAPAFLGLARASRTAFTPALPAFALVLALTVTSFAGLVRTAVVTGQVAASWQRVGADATVTSSSAFSPAAARAVADVPGVTHAAAVLAGSWTTSAGSHVEVIAVDPGSYASLAAHTPGFAQVPAGLLATPSEAGAAQPVLVSPQAAAELGSGTATLSASSSLSSSPVSSSPVSSLRVSSLRPVRVRVAGLIASTPALPGGGAFVLMPLAAITSARTSARALSNEMLLVGGSIDQARLATVVRQLVPGGVVTSRADALSALAGGPLQHGAFMLFSLAAVVAAILGLAVLLLELALGAPERRAALARLASLGLGERQRAWVVALEVLPAVIAAAAAAWVCSLALPWVLAPDLDLSVFTGSPVAGSPVAGSVSVRLVADVGSVAVPLAGLAVLAAVAVSIEIRTGRAAD